MKLGKQFFTIHHKVSSLYMYNAQKDSGGKIPESFLVCYQHLHISTKCGK